MTDGVTHWSEFEWHIPSTCYLVSISRPMIRTKFVTRCLKMRRFSKNSVLRYGLKCKLFSDGSLVKLGFRQKTIRKHLIFHITNLQLRECIAKGVYLVVL